MVWCFAGFIELLGIGLHHPVYSKQRFYTSQQAAVAQGNDEGKWVAFDVDEE